MRLIDGDALKKGVEFLQDNTWPEDLSARMPRIIEEAETIPAIPVEWLRGVHENWLLTPDEMEFRDWLIERWQNEQEAR